MTMTTLKRGTEVLVLAFGNKQLRRRVWEDLERGVAICREEEYQRACRDEDEATCTVFPKEDILEVYEEREEQS
jgi:hypothetical protein